MVSEVREVFKNLPRPGGVIFPKYEPEPSHGDPIQPQNYKIRSNLSPEITTLLKLDIIFLIFGPSVRAQRLSRAASILTFQSGSIRAIRRSRFQVRIPETFIFGRHSAENGSETYRFARGSPQKVKKTSRESATKSPSTVKINKFARFGTNPPQPRQPPNCRHGPLFGPSLHTHRGPG